MITRRQSLQLSLAATALLVGKPRALWAELVEKSTLITRAIPKSGERLPMVGLGSSASFAALARSGELDPLREVLRAMAAQGATVFDTAPSYGESEAVAGQLAKELGLTDSMFWATKVNVAGRGGGSADPDAARTQIESSFQHLGKPVIDLIQVHNLGDVPVQMGILKELRAEKRIRYIGVTSTRAAQYPELEQVMRDQPIDFIGIDYAIDNEQSAERILPLAEELGIGVLVYLPFGRTRLWERVRGQALPDWAAEFDAHSWAQCFLKFVTSHPAVTVVTPATSKVGHMVDNLGAAVGKLPDAAQRRRMREYVAKLPQA
jgi:aryl-alcohol dehydrogenase-like predicted oxidoreductase